MPKALIQQTTPPRVSTFNANKPQNALLQFSLLYPNLLMTLTLEQGKARKKGLKLSFTESFARKLVPSPSSACETCLGLGFIYIHKSASGPAFALPPEKKGGFQLCSCLEGLCGNGSCSPPYEVYEAKKEAFLACACRLPRLYLKRIQRLEARAHIPPRYAGRFLDDISMRQEEELKGEGNTLGIALDHATQIVSEYSTERAPMGLYLSGGTGSGKTLLSCAILNELLRFHKISVRYAKVGRDILGKIRASYNPNSGIYGEAARIEEGLAKVRALVIDDFDIYKETEWVQSILYDLIDARYENNLLTVVNSNKPLSFWKDTAGGRIYSRLIEMCPEIHIQIPDHRTSIGAQNSYY